MRLFSFISTGTINFNDIPQRSNCIVSWNTFIIFIRINILRNVCLSNLNVSRKNVLCVIINKSLKTKLQIQKSYFITLSSILLSAQYLRTIYWESTDLLLQLAMHINWKLFIGESHWNLHWHPFWFLGVTNLHHYGGVWGVDNLWNNVNSLPARKVKVKD